VSFNRQTVTERSEEVFKDAHGNTLRLVLEVIDGTWARVRAEHEFGGQKAQSDPAYFTVESPRERARMKLIELRGAALDLGWEVSR